MSELRDIEMLSGPLALYPGGPEFYRVRDPRGRVCEWTASELERAQAELDAARAAAN